ncbi:MAG TPA: hypothetical protein VMQ62_05460, partial [Dongiaceae bacterium]|nr:hypothetical protein [Dongiaceae bacterium]
MPEQAAPPGAGAPRGNFRFASVLPVAVVLCGLCCFAAASGSAKDRPVAARNPTWQVDLRSQGYQVDLTRKQGDGEEDTGLAFGSDDELVVIDHTVRGSNPNSAHKSAHAFVIDAHTGAVERQRAWAGSPGGVVFATASGNYAIHDGGTVLYGPGLVEEIARSPIWVGMISQGGRRFAAPIRAVK